jgi:hypothetical protein
VDIYGLAGRRAAESPVERTECGFRGRSRPGGQLRTTRLLEVRCLDELSVLLESPSAILFTTPARIDKAVYSRRSANELSDVQQGKDC